MATYSSVAALIAAIKKEAQAALEETVDKSYQDCQKNVDGYYNSPQGRYQRTGQLASSVECSVSGLHGEICLDTEYRYNPSGRDTQTIYNYAESGGLLGNGGFWAKTEEDIEKNINECFGKHFSKK